jgi:hypothetical protein
MSQLERKPGQAEETNPPHLILKVSLFLVKAVNPLVELNVDLAAGVDEALEFRDLCLKPLLLCLTLM